MKFIAITTALILSCAAYQSATSLEMTATARDVKEANPEINITSQNAILSAAITKINKDVLAILECNKKNMFFKPKDATADSDGCVGASITTTTTNHTVNLPTVQFDSYPGYTKNSKGYKGSSVRYIDVSALVADGAQAISVRGSRTTTGSNAWGSCGGSVTMNIANVKSNYSTTKFECHYDNSPNRRHEFHWSYDAATKRIAMTSLLSQTSMLRTSAQLTGVTATYSVTKTVLKVGDGK